MASCCRCKVQRPRSACEVVRNSMVQLALALSVVIGTISSKAPCSSFVAAPARSTKSLPKVVASSAQQRITSCVPVLRDRSAFQAGAVFGVAGAVMRWKPWDDAPAILRTWSFHSILSFAYLVVMLVDLHALLLPGTWHSSGIPVLLDLVQEPDGGFTRLVGYLGVAVSLLGWARLDDKTSQMKRVTVEMAVLWNIFTALSLDSNYCLPSLYFFDVFQGRSQVFAEAVVLTLLVHSLYTTWCVTTAPLKDRQSMYGTASSDESATLFVLVTTLLPMWAQLGPQAYNMLAPEVSVHLPQQPEILGYHANSLRAALHINNFMMFGMSLRRYNAISDSNASLIFGGLPTLATFDVLLHVHDLLPKLDAAGLVSAGAILCTLALLIAGAAVIMLAHKHNRDAQAQTTNQL